MSATNSNEARLATVRRLYFYVVALISFIVALAAFDDLVRVLDEIWLGGQSIAGVGTAAYLRNAVARSGGLLVVATPIFLLHWRAIQRMQEQAKERQSALRKFFLYTASGVALGYALFRAYDLIYGIVVLALGAPVADSEIWPSGWLHLLIITAISALLQVYFHHALVEDGDYGQEEGAAGTIRRLYQTIAGLAGLGLILFGSSDLLETGWIALTGAFVRYAGAGWWREPLANGLSLLLLGILVARVNWQRWRAITTANPLEGQSALRRVYLYAAVVVGALATLVPTANIFREFLLLLLAGGIPDGGDILDKLASPVSFMPAGITIWVWHWRYLRQEANTYGESSQGETVRRIYYYAVAATGLALLWYGASEIVLVLLDWVIGGRDAVGPRIWVEPLATGLSLVAVGAPIWALHWRAVQSVALRDDARGLAERSSAPRKIYLYGVAMVGALLILFYLAQVVYRVLLLLMGDPAAGLFSSEMAEEVARSITAVVLWAVHVLAIRRDAQLGMETPTPAFEGGDGRRAALQDCIARLESDLEQARAELAELDAQQHTAAECDAETPCVEQKRMPTIEP